MRKQLKRLFALVLVCMIAMTTVMPVEAAQKGMIVTYKGKKATLFTKDGTSTQYSVLAKKWGAGKVKAQDEFGRTTYLYKKGKSSVEVLDTGADNNHYTSYSITIKDKNIKLNGVTVGMKKKTAIKKLQSAFGKGQVAYLDGTVKAVQDVKKDKTIYVYFAEFMPITFKYNKTGKITQIKFWCS